MVFGDWVSDETFPLYGRPTHTQTCTCYMNSVPLSCHTEAVRRTFIAYGPSWRVPLHAKGLDTPYYARIYSVGSKIRKMQSGDGVVHEDAVKKLDKSVVYTGEEMQLILAHLNVMKSLIDYQKKTKNYNFT